MKLIIDIPDHIYEMVTNTGTFGCYRFDTRKAIKNGTPLPKGHGRKFEEIVVEYPPADLCAYPEYRGKPYFSIKYEENGEHIIGFGTYKPEVFSQYLREYFIEADKEVKE